jgi:hypothetical protein
MAFNPKVLQNLKPFNADNARKMQEKAVASRNLNTAIRENLRITAEQWNKVKAEIPKMDPLEVLEMCMVKALADNDVEAASRYASLLAPYRSPKLQAIEQKITTDVQDMSDEELRLMISQHSIKLLEEDKDASTD